VLHLRTYSHREKLQCGKVRRDMIVGSPNIKWAFVKGGQAANIQGGWVGKYPPDVLYL